ncbi:MAG TPA: isoprenoid biosynthesis glyoxalase ElbB [Verrucomicrobiota bacterium]|nr:isoprenoid biosynthesis glyoxalase ElbB [Verrucomicrobiota bacterium]HNU49854.1 isoprenoid biosynthesis glyoxalase ElbB [Verrucomicrobiota bacterium]
MKKVAVILGGCGVHDGSEIQESVLVLLALDRANAQAVCAAPDMPQHDVVNHLTGQPSPREQRNVLVESARIARDPIIPLGRLQIASVDGVIVPGGFGAAKNLSTFGLKGEAFDVHPEVARVLREARQAGKPLGFVCIAPAIAARLFGPEQVEFTIGQDAATARLLERYGGRHVNCPVHNVVIDGRLKIVTTPAYMLAERITEAEAGIQRLVQAVLEMA